MPKPRAADPRNRTLLLRLTGSEMDTLESIAHLERTTANAYAYSQLVEHLATMASDSHVQRDLANRAAYDARAAASTTELRPKRAMKRRGPESTQTRTRQRRGQERGPSDA